METTTTEAIEPKARVFDGKEDEKLDKRSYKLQFRYLNRLGSARGMVIDLMFWFRGDLANARIKARNHCGKMNYRYINVSPFIVDLDAREALKDQDGFTDEFES